MLGQRLAYTFKLFFPVSAVLCVMMMFLGQVGCAPGEDAVTNNPVPVITAMAPTGKVSYLPAFTLTVDGTGFVRESAIAFNGVIKSTLYVSETRLSCTINPSDIAAVAATLLSSSTVDSALNRDIPVEVRSPMPGGGTSNSISFEVRDNHVFSTPVPVITGSHSYLNPSMVVQDAGHICIAYQFYDNLSGTYAIDFLRSGAEAQGWGSSVRIVQSNRGCYNPCLLLDATGRLNIVFFAEDRLYYSRSSDNGSTWNYPVAVCPQVQENLEPTFTIDRNGGLYVIWPQMGNTLNSGLLFTRSTDNGVTWSSPVNLFSKWGDSTGVNSPTLAVDSNGGVFAAWSARPMGGTRYDYTYFNYSHNNGTTWQNTETTLGESISPSLVVDRNGRLDLILAATVVPLRYGIFFKQSADRGLTWITKSTIKDSGWSYVPQLKLDSAGNMNVVYLNDFNFFFSRSVDGGATWSDGFMLGGANAMAMSLDNVGNVYVATETSNPSRISVASSR